MKNCIFQQPASFWNLFNYPKLGQYQIWIRNLASAASKTDHRNRPTENPNSLDSFIAWYRYLPATAGTAARRTVAADENLSMFEDLEQLKEANDNQITLDSIEENDERAERLVSLHELADPILADMNEFANNNPGGTYKLKQRH